MKKKKILIVAPFCSLSNEPYFNRFLYISKLLSNEYDITLVTSKFRHFDKKHRDYVSESKFNLVLIDEPGYKTNVSFSRIYSHHIFCRNFSKWLTSCNKGDFDLVYSAFPLIQTNIILSKMKIALGFKLIIDVQDIWPEAISSAFPVLSNVPLNLIPFTNKSNKAYSSADALVAVSQTYLDRAMLGSKEKPSTVVYIGSDFDIITNAKKTEGTNESFKLVYIGTLSHSYDIGTVIYCVNKLKKDGLNIEFHIFGGGPFEKDLKDISGSGIFFHGFVSYHNMVSFVKVCDVAVNALSRGAKQSVTNKLSDFLSIGIPIINSQENPEVLSLLSSVCHENYKAGSVDDLSRVILLLYKMKSELYFKPNNEFNREIQYSKIKNIINKVIENV